MNICSSSLGANFLVCAVALVWFSVCLRGLLSSPVREKLASEWDAYIRARWSTERVPEWNLKSRDWRAIPLPDGDGLMIIAHHRCYELVLNDLFSATGFQGRPGFALNLTRENAFVVGALEKCQTPGMWNHSWDAARVRLSLTVASEAQWWLLRGIALTCEDYYGTRLSEFDLVGKVEFDIGNWFYPRSGPGPIVTVTPIPTIDGVYRLGSGDPGDQTLRSTLQYCVVD